MKSGFVFLFISCLTLPGSSQTIDEHNQRAVENIYLHNYQGAIEEFTKIIAINPQNPKGYFDRAIAKEQLKDYPGALSDYTRAIELDTTNPDTYYLRGLLKSKLEDYPGAIDDYSKALELESGNPDAYYFRGLAEAALHYTKNAVHDLTKAIELHSVHTALAYDHRGQIRMELNNVKGAMEDYDLAIQWDPDNPEFYLHRGELKIKSGQKASGRSDIRRYKKIKR